ncbi:hypothetical protein SAMN05421820_101309 [Pedobacter steynii]|uniref:Uncharacterized protein n=1 Tax=Pedobacter steynii TaxID=430522 RepID=A0A1G9JMM8_9SPHI|nr:hypothetical protein [Pedobacter steynii]NQX38295.1 hypothetical protein [Pedobacter steynii]SDL38485.1 hypothetical protein SAMN05421820_101309 [Pedobacter steynii]
MIQKTIKLFITLVVEGLQRMMYGIFKFSARNVSHVETEGRIVTGQNFQSSSGVALKIIELINDAKNE